MQELVYGKKCVIWRICLVTMLILGLLLPIFPVGSINPALAEEGELLEAEGVSNSIYDLNSEQVLKQEFVEVSGVEELQTDNTEFVINEDSSALMTQLESSLIAYYSFDNNDVSDKSGNGYHGKTYGTPTYVNGKKGKAMEFDGIDDWVELTDFSVPESFSISTWVNPYSTAKDQAFIGKHTATGAKILLYGYYGAGHHVRVRNDVSIEGTKETGYQHLVLNITKLSSTQSNVQVYKNGALIWEKNINDVIGSTTGKPWVLGQDWDNSSLSDFFHGAMDEVAFYDHALTPEEISAVYNDTGVLAYYSFDNSLNHSDLTIPDASGKGNHGKTYGAVKLIDGRAGKGKAAEFDGKDDWIELTDFTVPESFTISAWINPYTSNDQQNFIGKHTSAGNNIFLIGYGNGGNHVRLGSSFNIQGTKSTGYQHLTVTVSKLNSTQSSVKLYKDGVLFWEKTLNSVMGSSLGRPWVLGQDWDLDELSDFFNGAMDDVAFYNSSLTQQEVSTIYTNGVVKTDSRLLAYYDFENIVQDESGNGNHGKINGGDAKLVNGKVGKALEFDGINDWVELTDFSVPESFSVSAWINPYTTNDQCFIGKHTSTGDNIFLYGHSGTGSNVTLRSAFNIQGTKTTGYQHVVVTVTKLNSTQSTVRVFKNGALVWEKTLNAVIGNTAGKPWVIGQDWDGSNLTDFFKGAMDEVIFYDYPLTAQEIASIYAVDNNLGVEEFYSLHSNAVGYGTSQTNVTNGNLYLNFNDLNIPGRGEVDLSLERSFNSLETEGGILGAGWRLNVEMAVKEDANGLLFIDEDGTKHYFLKDGTKYISPSGVFIDAVKNPDNTFKLTTRDRIEYKFKADGKLEKISDANGNSINITYSGSNILDIIDSVGRKLTFSGFGTNTITVTGQARKIIYTKENPTGRVNSVKGEYKDSAGVFKTAFQSSVVYSANTIEIIDPNDKRVTYNFSNNKLSSYSKQLTVYSPKNLTGKLVNPQTLFSYEKAKTTITTKGGADWTKKLTDSTDFMESGSSYDSNEVEVTSGSIRLKKSGADLSSTENLTTGTFANTALVNGQLKLKSRTIPTFLRTSTANTLAGTSVEANQARYETAKFGKGILIEEGTTNLISTNPSFEDGNFTGWSAFSSYGGATYSVTTEKKYHGSYSEKIVTTGTATSSPGVEATPITISPNATYTGTIYLAGDFPDGKVQLRLRWFDSNNNIVKDDNVNANALSESVFKRYALTSTAPSNAAKVRLMVRMDRTIAGTIFLDAAQIEAKGYYTSFKDPVSSRTNEILSMPTANVLSATEGSLGLWAYIDPNGPHSANNTNWSFLFSVATIQSNPYDELNQISIRRGNGTTSWRVQAKGSAGSSAAIDLGTISSPGWYRFDVTWKQGVGVSGYLNGVLKGSIGSTYVPSSFTSTAYIGSWASGSGGTFSANTRIDDFSVSNVARNAQEISDLYKSGLPSTLDNVTTYKCNFENNLITGSGGYRESPTYALSTVGTAGSSKINMNSSPSWLMDLGVILARASTAYKPDGTSVGSGVARYENGKFGKAIRIEEATTNRVPDGHFSTQTFQKPYSSAVRGTLSFVTGGKYGTYRLKHVATDNDSYTTPYAGSSASLYSASAGQVWTASVDAKSDTANTPASIWIFALDSSHKMIGSTYLMFNAGTSWQRKSVTYTLPANTAYVSTRVDNDGGTGKVVYWDGWSLENKPIPTTFHNSNRQTDYITAPTMISPNKGSIEAWFYVDDLAKWKIPNFRNLVKARLANDVDDGIVLYYAKSTNTFNLKTGSDATNISYAKVSATGLKVGWNRLAGRWSSSESNIFLNNTKGTPVTNPNLPLELSSTMAIGSSYGNSCLNSLLDDLRISNIARSDQEFNDAYNSTGPVAIDDYTTLKLNFDDSLQSNIDTGFETNLSVNGGTDWQGWRKTTNGGSISGIVAGTSLANAKLKIRQSLINPDVGDNTKPWVDSTSFNILTSPKVKTGTWTSPVYDIGQSDGSVQGADGIVSWKETLKLGTSISVEYRTSNENLDWGAWTPIDNGGVMNHLKYVQYRVNLHGSDIDTPELLDITFSRSSSTHRQEYLLNSDGTLAAKAVYTNPEEFVLTQFSYNSQKQVIQETDGRLNSTEYKYDSENRLEYEWSPYSLNDGQITRLETRYYYQDSINKYKPTLKEEKEKLQAGGERAASTRATKYDYDANGNLVKEIFDYTNQNRLETNYSYVNGQLEDTWVIKVSENQLPGSEISRVKNIYDANNLYLMETVDALGQKTKHNYDFNTGDKLSEVDNFGTRTDYTYKDFGLVETEKKTFTVSGVTYTPTTVYEYDDLGNKTKVINPGNIQIEYTYDEDNRQVILDQRVSVKDFGDYTATNETTDENNRIKEYNFYDIVGNLYGTQDGKGKITYYITDWAGRELEEKDPLNHKTTNVYDENGNKIESTNYTYSDGEYTTQGTLFQSYDELNRLIGETDPAAEEPNPEAFIKEFYYDIFGNQIKSKDIEENEFHQVYDKYNRVINEWSYPSGSVVKDEEKTYKYDDFGNKVEETNTSGTTKYQYDLLNRLTMVTDPANKITTYQYTPSSYDSYGENRKTTLEPGGAIIEETFDGLDRLVSEVKKEGSTVLKTVTNTYNSAGFIEKEIVTANGQTDESSYTYDETGKTITEKAIKNGVTVEKKYKYDSNSNLLSTWLIDYSQGSGGEALKSKTTYEYDSLNRITKETTESAKGTKTQDYSYADNSRQTISNNAAGTTITEYDKGGKLSKVIAPGEQTYEFLYNANALLETVKQPFVDVNYTYENDRIKLINITNGLGTILNFDYSYNQDGKVETAKDIDTRGDTSYTYHPTGQLKSWKVADKEDQYYEYDANGNLKKITDFKQSAETIFNYNVQNQLESTSEGKKFQYDTNGNLKEATQDTLDAQGNPVRNMTFYEYTSDNRLKQYKETGVTNREINYQYDAEGRRIQKTIGTDSYEYEYDGNLVVKEVVKRNGATDTIYYFTDGDDSLLGLSINGIKYYYQFNSRGDVVALTDIEGNIAARYQYDPWGKVSIVEDYTLYKAAEQNIYRYVGKYGVQYDPHTQLYLMTWRDYDPTTARFIIPDTYEGEEEEPLSKNRYMYAEGDPVNYIDPSGHSVVKIGVAIVKTVVKVIKTGVKLYKKYSKKDKKAKRGTAKVSRYSGKLIKVSKADPAADALAKKIGGQSRVKFANDPAGREFDVVSKKYIAQSKPALKTINASVRNQAKATFEAAKETGRSVYYHFQGKPAQDVINKLKEYSQRYGVDLVIDTKPL